MGGGDQELNIGSERERIHMVPFSESYSSMEISSLSIRPFNELVYIYILQIGQFRIRISGKSKKEEEKESKT